MVFFLVIQGFSNLYPTLASFTRSRWYALFTHVSKFAVGVVMHLKTHTGF